MGILGRRQGDDWQLVPGLTCTVLSRTTWDTVSRSCAAMPGFPRPRVNFLSLIVAGTDRCESILGRGGCRVPPHRSSRPASPVSDRCHHARMHAPAASRDSLAVTIDYDRARERLPTPSPVSHRQSRPVAHAAQTTGDRRYPAGEAFPRIYEQWVCSFYYVHTRRWYDEFTRKGGYPHVSLHIEVTGVETGTRMRRNYIFPLMRTIKSDGGLRLIFIYSTACMVTRGFTDSVRLCADSKCGMNVDE